VQFLAVFKSGWIKLSPKSNFAMTEDDVGNFSQALVTKCQLWDSCDNLLKEELTRCVEFMRAF
jgi:hypothetical protein